MIALLLEGVLASALLMLLVLVVRAPVRRAFGARVAYALWAMPVLRLLLPPMPEGWRGQALPTLPAPEPITFYLGRPVATLPVVAPEGGIAWPEAALMLWGGVAAVFLGWQVVTYLRFRHRVLRNGMTVDRVGSITVVETAAATGPLAFGVLDRVVAFPRDFPARFDRAERELALAHELNHHARGDLIANWIALAMLALHWFNPVAWFAWRAFRADQEMANDAGVLARCGPDAAHAYGCAIVKAAHGRALTPACHLHTINDLKGRLRMLGRKRVSGKRMAAGIAGTMAMAAGALALTASGTQAAETMRAKVETVTGVELAALDPIAAVSAAPTATAPAATERRKSRVVVTRNGRTETYDGAAADAYIAANPLPEPPAPPAIPATRSTADRVAIPPVPPVPAMPPMPPMPDVPVVAERDCGKASAGSRQIVMSRTDNGRQVTVICTDRIDAIARAAASRADYATRATAARNDASARAAAVRANAAAVRGERQAMIAERRSMVAERRGMVAQRHGLSAALAGLQSARRTMLTSVPAEHRAEALRGIDEAIAEMRAEMKETERD